MNENKKNDVLMPQRNVNGFDPLSSLSKIEEIDENGQLVERFFMPTQVAMEWFLTVYPEGCFNHTVQITDRKCIAYASVFRNVNDTRAAATATCTKLYDDTEAGKFYEQNAVTAAYRKALEYLGFGAPYGVNTDANNSVKSVVNEPTATNAVKPAVSETNTAAQKDDSDAKTEKTTKGKGRKSTKINADDAIIPAPVTTAATKNIDSEPVTTEELADTVPENQSITASAQQEKNALADSVIEPETVPEPEPTGGNSEFPKNLEEAKKFVITRGKVAGMTIEDVSNQEGNDFVRRFYEYIKRTESGTPLITALRIFCEFSGC